MRQYEPRSHCLFTLKQKTDTVFCTKASKQSKERKCTRAPNSNSLLKNRKVEALHMILNSILLLTFLFGNIVNGEMNNKCSSAVFICLHCLDKYVLFSFIFFIFFFCFYFFFFKTIEPVFVKSSDSFSFCGHYICHIGIQITSAA